MLVGRARLRRAAEVSLGLAAALSTRRLDAAWADALADFPEEAQGLLWRANADRDEARLLSRGRRM